MIRIQVVPRPGVDAWALLRAKVLHEAATWYWGDRAKARLRHIQSDGYIEVRHAGGVVIAEVVPKDRRDLFYLAEKFMGRLVAWFEDELAAINVQLLALPEKPRRRWKAGRKRKGQSGR
jgi:hypothetical protein